jgi:hypothetical protein
MSFSSKTLRWLAALGIAVAAASAAASLSYSFGRSGQPSPRARAALPPVILWAWERPEDLRTLDARETGVAFLACTVFLSGDTVALRPRLQPLRVSPGTPLIAVVRIESRLGAPATLSAAQRAQAVRAIAAAGREPGISALQVDFDATSSERAFYRELLEDLRARLPAKTALSITALASWCMGDDWIAGLPVDDAVPMLFRMGADRARILDYLEEGRDFRPPVCKQSLGISTDEPLTHLPSGRRLYIFRPRAWTPAAVKETLEGAQRWK